MAIQLGEGQPHFGPDVYRDEKLSDEYASVDVDVVRMGENLRADFPDISQEEWDTAMVYLTDGLLGHLGGVSANMLPVKESFSASVLHGAAMKISDFFTGAEALPIRKFKKISGDHDIVVAVNLASELTERVSKTGRFFPEGEKYDPDTILAHELQHTVGHLTHNRLYESHGAAVKRWWRRAAAHAGSVATGLATGAAGAITDIVAVKPFAETPFLIGGGAMAGGAVLIATPVYLMAKHKTLASSSFGIEVPKQPYSGGEDSANAYALATQDKWQGVISLEEHGTEEK